jgi:hypothetical protein
MKRLIVCLILFALVGCVAAVTGAKCVGNTLEYSDMFGTVTKRDCSILHSGQGQVFRGECRAYDGGADCWRTDGDVTPAYVLAVRGAPFNDSNPWADPYNPPSTTTTIKSTSVTIPLFDITKCPKCEVCQTCQDCTQFVNIAKSANDSLGVCESNYNVCNDRLSKMVFKDVYDTQRADYENKITMMSSDMASKDKEIARLTANAGLYFNVAVAACVIVVIIIGIWVKYEWIGDPKIKDGLGIK